MGEHDRAVGRHGFAEPNAVYSCDQLRKRLSSLFQRALTEIAPFEVSKVEGHE